MAIRLHWVWPLYEAGCEPFGLDDHRRLLDAVAPLGAALSLWPVIERRRGYFLNDRTSSVFERRLGDLPARLGAAGLEGRVGLTVDLEPPLPWLLRRFRAPLAPPDPAALDRIAAWLRSLRARGTLTRVQAAVVPGRAAGKNWDDLILMAYGSVPDLTGRLEVAYPRITAILSAIGGAAARLDNPAATRVVALGLLNRGVLVSEPTFTRPEVFTRAVALAAPRGARELALYGLCGLLCGPEGMVTPDLELRDRWDPCPPRRVRAESELSEWVAPLVAALSLPSRLRDPSARRSSPG
ncbi:MAG: hypothetical protein HYY06_31620 [Deltaproteobacteria bacterium]|nr:hypothetical protein [Deltaproteobacteria bacterium]